MSLGKVCVTGSKGFIGKALCQRLHDLGYQVRTIPHQMLSSFFELQAYLTAEQPDYIFHLAAYGNHSHQTEDDAIIYANILGTWTLLQASKHVNYSKFINFGSSSEYGDKTGGIGRKGAMDERDVLETTTMYGASKEASTALCRAFEEKYNKRIITIRPFSVYGEGEAEHRFIPTVIRSLKYGETFTLDPNVKHDWIYIDDFIDGVILAMDAYVSPLNIGTGKQSTNLEIVTTLEEISGKKAHYTVTGDDDYPDWVADNSRLRAINWTQKHSLREGLKKTYERSI